MRKFICVGYVKYKNQIGNKIYRAKVKFEGGRFAASVILKKKCKTATAAQEWGKRFSEIATRMMNHANQE